MSTARNYAIVRQGRRPRIDTALKRHVAMQVNTMMAEGTATAAAVEAIAKTYGINRATAYRWAKKYRTAAPAATAGPAKLHLVLPVGVEEVFCANKGNVARTAAEAKQLGLITFSESTLRRLVNADKFLLSTARQHDSKTALLPGVVNYTVQARNLEWQIDNVELSLEVIGPDGTQGRPTITIVIDSHSRFVLGWAMTLIAGNSDTAVEALSMAARRRVESVPMADGTTQDFLFGGVAHRVIHDNGKEFLSRHVVLAANAWAMPMIASGPYSPYLKGKVERFNRTVGDWASAYGPVTSGIQTRTGGLRYGEGPVMSLDDFEALFENWLYTYNFEREHAELGKATPAQRWAAGRDAAGAADPDEGLRFVDDELLERHACMPLPDTRKVRDRGVVNKNTWYKATELIAYYGQDVTVRINRSDATFVDIWDGDTFVCRAYREDVLSHRVEQDILDARENNAARRRTLVRDSIEYRRVRQEADIMCANAARAGRQAATTPAPSATPSVASLPTEHDASAVTTAAPASVVVSMADRLNAPYRTSEPGGTA